MKIPAAVGNLVPALLVAAVLIGYDHFVREKAAPVVSPVAAAIKQYHETYPAFLGQLRDQLRSGQIASKAALVAALATHAQPVVAALDAAYTPITDPKTGNFTNQVAAAAIFDDACKSIGGK